MSDWKLLNTSTASGASSVEFTDLTGYKIFKFVFVDVNPATDSVRFSFQVNASGGSGFNETITSTFSTPTIMSLDHHLLWVTLAVTIRRKAHRINRSLVLLVMRQMSVRRVSYFFSILPPLHL